jgi:putative aldouronate transport system permease protein
VNDWTVKNLRIKMGASEKIFRVFNIIFMLCFMFITAYPVWHVIVASFSDGKELLKHSGLLLYPLGLTAGAYKNVFRDPMILRGYVNTLIVVFFGVILNIAVTAVGAYVLSRRNVLWQKFLMSFILFTMLFKGGTIPFYFTVTGLGMDDSLLALIIPTAVNTFYLIIMRTSFLSVPESLEESARLDGAGHLTVLLRIVMPLSMPIIAVMLLYYAVDRWNGWFNSMLFIKTRAKLPLQIILRGILLQNDTSMMTQGTTALDQESVGEAIKYAVIVVATVPILCVYPFLQKYFVKGALVGAVKE